MTLLGDTDHNADEQILSCLSNKTKQKIKFLIKRLHVLCAMVNDARMKSASIIIYQVILAYLNISSYVI